MRTINIKKHIKRVGLLLIFGTIFLFLNVVHAEEIITENDIYANYIGAGKAAAIEEGAGKDVCKMAVDGGLLGYDFYSTSTEIGSENDRGAPSYDLLYDIPQDTYVLYELITSNNNYHPKLNAKSTWGKTTISMYNSVYNEIKNSPHFKYAFDQIEKTKGQWDNQYWKKFIISIMTRIITERIDALYQASVSGCRRVKVGNTWKSTTTFIYDGQEYNCEDIKNHMSDRSGTNNLFFGFEIFKDIIWGRTVAKDALKVEEMFSPNWNTNFKTWYNTEIKDWAEKYRKTTRPSSGEGDTSDCPDNSLYCFGKVKGGYYPSLAKIYENSKKMGNETLKNKDDESLVNNFNELIEEIIRIIALFGRYIVYSAILFFGVMAIFNGASGKATFKENMPYLLTAIVFFYKAPDLVKIMQNMFGQINDLEELAKNTFATVVYVARVATFCGIIFTGIKLMFGSAKNKADVSKSLLPIFIGCVFVFCSSLIVDITTNGLVGNTLGNTSKRPTIAIEGEHLTYIE